MSTNISFCPALKSPSLNQPSTTPVSLQNANPAQTFYSNASSLISSTASSLNKIASQIHVIPPQILSAPSAKKEQLHQANNTPVQTTGSLQPKTHASFQPTEVPKLKTPFSSFLADSSEQTPVFFYPSDLSQSQDLFNPGFDVPEGKGYIANLQDAQKLLPKVQASVQQIPETAPVQQAPPLSPATSAPTPPSTNSFLYFDINSKINDFLSLFSFKKEIHDLPSFEEGTIISEKEALESLQHDEGLFGISKEAVRALYPNLPSYSYFKPTSKDANGSQTSTSQESPGESSPTTLATEIKIEESTPSIQTNTAQPSTETTSAPAPSKMPTFQSLTSLRSSISSWEWWPWSSSQQTDASKASVTQDDLSKTDASVEKMGMCLLPEENTPLPYYTTAPKTAPSFAKTNQPLESGISSAGNATSSETLKRTEDQPITTALPSFTSAGKEGIQDQAIQSVQQLQSSSWMIPAAVVLVISAAAFIAYKMMHAKKSEEEKQKPLTVTKAPMNAGNISKAVRNAAKAAA